MAFLLRLRIHTAWPLATVLLLIAGCTQDVPPSSAHEIVRPVKLFTVGSQIQSNLRNFPARVVASQATELSFRLPGELVQLPVRAGHEVKQGDLIAKLDDTDLQNQLVQSRSNYELAKAEFNRIKSLYDRKLVAQTNYDQAKTSLTSAEVALKLAQDNLRYTEIHAPFSGRIGLIRVENHQVVLAKQPIVLIQAIDTIDIQVELPEDIVANIRQDPETEKYEPEVRFPTLGEKAYQARYKEHATEATPGTQGYRITLVMPQVEGGLILPGMTANVTIDLQAVTHTAKDSFLLIPTQCIARTDNDGQTKVWRYNPDTGQVQPVVVTLGRLTNEGFLVEGELSAGDQIVAAGLTALHEGMTVKPLSKPRGL